MAKLNTVNVVESIDDILNSIRAFSEDPDGNKEAEDCFKAIVKENMPDVIDEEMGIFIAEGYFEQGNFQVFLAHSN